MKEVIKAFMFFFALMGACIFVFTLILNYDDNIKVKEEKEFDFSIQDFKADMYIMTAAGDTVAYRSGKNGRWQSDNWPAALDRMTELLVEEYHRSMVFKKQGGHELPITVKNPKE